MNEKENLKKEITNNDLARMMVSLDKRFSIRIDSLETYMRDGFSLLNNKIDNVDEHLSFKIDGMGRRLDDLAENKVSKINFQELTNRVVSLEPKILQGTKK